MNKKGEVFLNKLTEAHNKIGSALESMSSSLERFRLASLEQVEAIRLIDEHVNTLIKTVASLNEKVDLIPILRERMKETLK